TLASAILPSPSHGDPTSSFDGKIVTAGSKFITLPALLREVTSTASPSIFKKSVDSGTPSALVSTDTDDRSSTSWEGRTLRVIVVVAGPGSRVRAYCQAVPAAVGTGPSACTIPPHNNSTRTTPDRTIAHGNRSRALVHVGQWN